MARCDDLNRWLDEGMPADGAAEARAHAAACPACAAMLDASETVERALTLPAPTVPEGSLFTARVMEQVRATSPLALPALPEIPHVRWWTAIFSEPGFAVAAATAAALILTPAAAHFDAGRSVALPVSVAMQSFGGQVGTTLAGWFGPAALAARLTPLSRVCLLVGFTPLLVWAGLWMFGVVERLVRMVPTRRG